MIEWEEFIALALERWGEQNVAMAREDIAMLNDGAPVFPWLEVLEGAAGYLVARGVWDEPDELCLVALRACHHFHARDLLARRPFSIAPFDRCQAVEIGDWFRCDLDDLAWDLTPVVRCLCGHEYKQCAVNGGKPRYDYFEVGGGGVVRDCACGQKLAKLTEPEQLEFAIA